MTQLTTAYLAVRRGRKGEARSRCSFAPRPAASLPASYRRCLQGDYRAFEPVLRTHAAELGRDALLSGYLGDLLQGMRAQVLVSLAAPYRRLRIGAVAAHFGIACAEAEALAAMVIRDGRLGAAARIDQVAQVLLLQPPPGGVQAAAAVGANPTKSAAPANAAQTAGARYDGIVRLGDQLNSLLGALAAQ